MDPFARDVVLLAIGWLLATLPAWFDRRRRLKAHWAVLRGELELCRGRAQGFLQAEIRAPNYRLPHTAYDTAFPVLIADGAIGAHASMVLRGFYDAVEDLNRGLDNAAAMLHARDMDGVEREYDRNLVKARNIVEKQTGGHTLYSLAAAVVDAKLALPFYRY